MFGRQYGWKLGKAVLTDIWSIVTAGVVISALGLIDDIRPLGWQPKLAVQLVVAAALVDEEE